MWARKSWVMLLLNQFGFFSRHSLDRELALLTMSTELKISSFTFKIKRTHIGESEEQECTYTILFRLS